VVLTRIAATTRLCSTLPTRRCRKLSDPDFDKIKSKLASDNPIDRAAGADLWNGKVAKGRARDAGKKIRDLYGASADKVLFFDAVGKTDVAFSLFGNILFGFLGAAVGIATEGLLQQGAVFDFWSDDKGINLPDLDAVAFGAALFDRFGAGISEDELLRYIASSIKSRTVHTRESIANCMHVGQGLKVEMRCRG
jgi:hypothetical protein